MFTFRIVHSLTIIGIFHDVKDLYQSQKMMCQWSKLNNYCNIWTQNESFCLYL